MTGWRWRCWSQYRMATTEQMHWVIAPGVRIEQTRRRLARLREAGLADRITLPRAGRMRVWFPSSYGVQLACEWPEMRGRRPSRTVSDPTAVRLKVGHALTVTETALAFLKDARRHGDLCRPLEWIPEVHHPIGSGEAVIPDALLYYRHGSDDGSMLRAFVEVDRATMGPERLAAKLTASTATCRPSRNRHWRTGGGAISCSLGCCSSWTAPAPPVPRPVSVPSARPPGT
ncbi:replication-relaxation family protein [Streptomyces sp. GLT-R25]